MTSFTAVLLLALATTSSAFAPAATGRASSSHLRLSSTAAPHDAEANVGSSWAGARFGDAFLHTGHWDASETHGRTAQNAMDAARASADGGVDGRGHVYSRSTTHERSGSVTGNWVPGAHAEAGNDEREWSGARYGDYGRISKAAAPTPSQWLE